MAKGIGILKILADKELKKKFGINKKFIIIFSRLKNISSSEHI